MERESLIQMRLLYLSILINDLYSDLSISSCCMALYMSLPGK